VRDCALEAIGARARDADVVVDGNAKERRLGEEELAEGEFSCHALQRGGEWDTRPAVVEELQEADEFYFRDQVGLLKVPKLRLEVTANHFEHLNDFKQFQLLLNIQIGVELLDELPQRGESNVAFVFRVDAPDLVELLGVDLPLLRTNAQIDVVRIPHFNNSIFCSIQCTDLSDVFTKLLQARAVGTWF
jgi:hypothetical protein